MGVNKEYIVLTTADGKNHSGVTIPAFRILNYRLSNNIWGLHNRTKYKFYITKGTKLIFYVSGHRDNAQSLVAEAIADEVRPWSSFYDLKKYTKEEWQYDVPTYAIELTAIRWFKKFVSFYDVMDKMSFLKGKNTKYWGRFIQGGAFRINAKDYFLIKEKILV